MKEDAPIEKEGNELYLSFNDKRFRYKKYPTKAEHQMQPGYKVMIIDDTLDYYEVKGITSMLEFVVRVLLIIWILPNGLWQKA